MRHTVISLTIVTVFWWGLFGIFIETLWTMLRKFKRRALRTETLAPVRVLLENIGIAYARITLPLRLAIVRRWPRLAVTLGCRRRRRSSPSGKRQAVSASSASPSPFSLLTVTNGWTFLMFGTGMPLLLGLSSLLMRFHAPRVLRFTLYALGFWGAEILWGTIIKNLGSRVPWDYSASRHSAFGGLIRRDYFVPWGLLGLLVEHYFSFWIDAIVLAVLAAASNAPALFPSF